MFGEPQLQTFHAAAIYHGAHRVARRPPACRQPRRGSPRRQRAPLPLSFAEHSRPPLEIVAMSMIDIRHSHSLSLAKARKAVEEVAQKLAERFEFEYEWDGDDLHFSRSGVDGRIALAPKELHVTAKLGFLVSAFKGPIEHEIRRVLDERFN
jgi:putative polyhydroxyalkanoate system protein